MFIVTEYAALRDHSSKFQKYDVLLSLAVVLILTNSVDPDEMLHNAAFLQGFHCFSMYLFMGFQ